ncbi:helix-turn-helix transcriptional regulator [Streptomyces sp. NPDC051207]|uniref:helix-turn-helix domain-containing protein n=1 Tax=Streptomyces sp. NPDC051207 TaxID=3154641 RepID=UPI00343F2737
MRMLGAQVQMARKAAGYTQRALAALLSVDEETIASIEQGRRALLPDLAEKLDELLDTKGLLATAVAKLPEIDQFPLYVEDYMHHEREAISLSWYDDSVLPGILQTEPYARAVFGSRVPAYSEEELAALTAARLKRQEVIHREDPPTMSLVIWEPALLFPLGGAEVHRAQIHHLRKSAEIAAITLQVLPLNRTTHAGLAGPFTLMETVDHQHLAYAAAHRGSRLVADPDDVSILTRKYAMLRSQALTPEDSMDLLDRLLGEL